MKRINKMLPLFFEYFTTIEDANQLMLTLDQSPHHLRAIDRSSQDIKIRLRGITGYLQLPLESRKIHNLDRPIAPTCPSSLSNNINRRRSLTPIINYSSLTTSINTNDQDRIISPFGRPKPVNKRDASLFLHCFCRDS